MNRPPPPIVPDETGKRYGKLAVIERAPNGKNRKAAWWCQCDCGRRVAVTGFSLRVQGTMSCGCLIGDPLRDGLRKVPEYETWHAITQRCYNPKASGYENYGGRGIRVCDRWRHSARTFIQDMGPKPTTKHSIERIDVNKDYSPENCKWATAKEQGRNTRATKLSPETAAEIRRRSAAGETNMALAREFGVHNSVISRAKNGFTWAP